MSNGAIRLVFELRRMPKDGAKIDPEKFDASQWEPVLCLHDRSCSIGAVELNMQGGSKIAWVINKVASVFKGLLRDYVVRTILNILTDKSGWILSKLNEALGSYWDLVLRTAELGMEDLEVATVDDVIAAKPEEVSNLIELVWREKIPLGMNLLMNDESGQLKVVDFPRGSQARTVCEKRSLDPEGFKGATVVAVNGIRYANDDDLFDALRDPSRPKTVSFELAETEEAERIKRFVDESTDTGKSAKKEKKSIKRAFKGRTVVFHEPGELGIEFANAPDNCGLVVRKFIEGEDGVVLAAERRDDINQGDLLTHINGHLVIGKDGEGRVAALKLLEKEGSSRPLALTFTEPYMHRHTFEKPEAVSAAVGGPKELVLEETKIPDTDTRRIMVSDFEEVDGIAEVLGVMIGDHLAFLNGLPVGDFCRILGEPNTPSMDDILKMLHDEVNYPIGLTFARPPQIQESRGWGSSFLGGAKKEDFNLESAETTCVTSESYQQLGCKLEMKNGVNVIVEDFIAVPGPFQDTLKQYLDAETNGLHLAIESINGQFVPAYASAQMVKSAMERSWKSDSRVELVLCDDERRDWVFALTDDRT